MDTAGILAELLSFATNVLSAQYDVKCTCGSRHCRCGSISQANASPSMSCWKIAISERIWIKDQIRTEKSQTRVRRTFVFDFSIGTVQTQGNAVISAMVRFAIFSECGAKWSYRSTLGVWGWRGARSTLLLCSQPLLWPCPHSTLHCLHCLHTPHFALHPVPHSAVYSATGTGEKIQGCWNSLFHKSVLRDCIRVRWFLLFFPIIPIVQRAIWRVYTIFRHPQNWSGWIFARSNINKWFCHLLSGNGG